MVVVQDKIVFLYKYRGSARKVQVNYVQAYKQSKYRPPTLLIFPEEATDSLS